MANSFSKAYQKESINSRLAGADSYTIITMLMQGALERLARGKGCIERNDLAGKAEHLSRASSIILALMESLDHSEGGEVTQNLGSLYEYMNMRITDASIEKSVEPLVEVMSLLNEIKSAWDAIPREEVESALQLQQQRG
ncbi:Flagellar secretion chaperone FliS [Pseudoalteromonas holothuriae]|uniref:Flagellar secretion chaperone FliS n=1 Tax=Pseudoalteromonas holothuriae TaxID=2963714 RepID=A0A9W4VR12_9GAMM|nr:MULTISPECIES: flagellar export chaperone FliS [unclassified Pseudoalteromonas]CAH9054235.1 Flagellar secretion chaperone FliS [Pseudoalteromonas sp. CIP111951]CAH9056895.1 Flagellar secretion chaperone FliS [Pseudoalteromonas sp. CIP111854]